MHDHDLPQGIELSAHDDEFREAPHARYDRLRASAPCHRDDAYGRWFLTRYEDVRTVLRHKAFSVDVRLTHENSYMRRVAGTGVSQGAGDTAYEPPLVLLDDPAHRRIRALMSKAFNPRTVEAMRPRVEAVTAELIEAMQDREHIDFIADFAAPLPTQVILDMMGMPEASRDDFKRWSEAVLMGYDPERGGEVQQRLREAYVAMSRAFRSVVEQRRHEPGSDLISEMVRAQEEHDRLSDLEIISLCTQLMVAGNVTTTDLIGNGMYALLTHPDQLERLVDDPALVEPGVEEMLRFDCPITETARVPLTDQVVGGCPLRRGDTVTVSLAAANRDPATFDRPHAFDIERATNPHLGFGSGIHVCLGAPLARLESVIALREFIARFPGVRLDPQQRPRRRHLPSFRGFTALPVTLHGAVAA